MSRVPNWFLERHLRDIRIALFAASECFTGGVDSRDSATVLTLWHVKVLKALTSRCQNHRTKCVFESISYRWRVSATNRWWESQLRRLECYVQNVLYRMMVVVIAALARIVRTPSFILMIIAASLRFGHREEPAIQDFPLIYPFSPAGKTVIVS